MKNKLKDLNNHLFEELERLNDDSLTGEALQEERERAKSMANIAQTIINNGELALKAVKHYDEYREARGFTRYFTNWRWKMRHKYSKIEDEFLINNVKGITLKELTDRFNKEFNLTITENAIQIRKTKLGIRSGIVGGQFKKGQIPFNKGKSWDEYMSKEGQKNSLKTTFKKGNIPKATRELWAERIDSDGYIIVKVAEPNKWKLKHRVIWENQYGSIPEGYNLIFADGNRQNCNLDNLILVSKAEMLIINQNELYKKDTELTKTGALIAKLINRVNKKEVKE